MDNQKRKDLMSHNWPALMAEWDRSNLSKTAFCKSNRISMSGLYRELRRQEPKANGFVKTCLKIESDLELMTCVIEVPGKMNISIKPVSSKFIRSLIET